MAAIEALSDQNPSAATCQVCLARGCIIQVGDSILQSVPTVSIFGYGLKTIADIQIQRDMQGKWLKLSFSEGTAGDSTIPESSAVLTSSAIQPVAQYHGTLYVDNDVKKRLKLELTRL